MSWTVAQNESAVDTFYTLPLTEDAGSLFATFTRWPTGGVLNLTAPIPTTNTTATLLGHTGVLEWVPLVPGGAGISIALPVFSPGTAPCDYAWAVRLTGIMNAA